VGHVACMWRGVHGRHPIAPARCPRPRARATNSATNTRCRSVPRSPCENFLYGFKAARRAARAAASAPWPSLPLALPLRPGQRRSAGAKRRDAGRSTYSEFTCAGSSLLPLPGLSGAGQNPSRPSVTAGQPHPSSCLVNAHAKTTLTEPARTRRWQLSEAGTRVARGAVDG